MRQGWGWGWGWTGVWSGDEQHGFVSNSVSTAILCSLHRDDRIGGQCRCRFPRCFEHICEVGGHEHYPRLTPSWLPRAGGMRGDNVQGAARSRTAVLEGRTVVAALLRRKLRRRTDCHRAPGHRTAAHATLKSNAGCAVRAQQCPQGACLRVFRAAGRRCLGTPPSRPGAGGACVRRGCAPAGARPRRGPTRPAWRECAN